MNLVLLITSGVFLSLSMMFVQMRKRKRYIETTNLDRLDTPQEYEIYFYHMYELIESDKLQDNIAMHGIIYNHVQYCEDA